MEPDEVVTIEGIVAGTAEDRAPYVHAVLGFGDGEVPIEHRDRFVVETTAGRVTIELAGDAIVGPPRKVAGPWRELSKHPTRPTGDYHPDGHVTLRGTWIGAGDRIAVIGDARDHAFVSDTGGHREAPERQVSLVHARAVGVGDDAAEDAKQALAQRARALAARARPKQPSERRYAWIARASLGLAGALVAAELLWHPGTLGIALTAVIFALMFAWCAWPSAPFPGGAADDEEITKPTAMVAVNVILLVPTTILLAVMADGAARRNGLASAGWIMLGLFPLIQLVRGVASKPHATPGFQILLPASTQNRWILILGLIATWIAAIALGVPQFSFDGPSV